jgi:hypothetical protein
MYISRNRNKTDLNRVLMGSILMVEAAGFAQVSAHFYQTTGGSIPQEIDLKIGKENRKFAHNLTVKECLLLLF